MTEVPSYVFRYAPLVWLESQEKHFPSDIGAQLAHTQPKKNFAPVNAPSPLSLDNLATINDRNVYLTSREDVTTKPAWLHGVKPNGDGKTDGATASAIIVNDHGGGQADVFYFYFFAYNEAPRVLGHEIGSHVGDWEYNMIRFQDGIPRAVWYSQHAYGQAFTYDAVEKKNGRPIAYVARGSHAIYATPGNHDHTIPGFNFFVGPLLDRCGRGTLWDPTLSTYTYRYDAGANTVTAYDGTSPTNWLFFPGRWGDQQYPDSDRRQKKLFWLAVTAKFSGGPTGPLDKQLQRTEVCPPHKDLDCFVSPFLRP